MGTLFQTVGPHVNSHLCGVTDDVNDGAGFQREISLKAANNVNEVNLEPYLSYTACTLL